MSAVTPESWTADSLLLHGYAMDTGLTAKDRWRRVKRMNGKEGERFSRADRVWLISNTELENGVSLCRMAVAALEHSRSANMVYLHLQQGHTRQVLGRWWSDLVVRTQRH